jgi:hypothetical protein
MRIAAIIFSAVTIFAAGLVTLTVGVLILFTEFSDGPSFAGSLTIPVAAGLLAWGGWCIASGLGIQKMRPWARISMLAVGSSLLLASASGWLDLFLDPHAGVTYMEGAYLGSARPELMIFYAVLAVLGMFWILFFSSGRVKSRFSGGNS